MLPLKRLSSLVGRIWKFGRARVESSSGETQIAAAELQYASELLGASEEEFRTLLELTAIAITEADPLTGRFVRVNRRFCELTGYTSEALLQMKVWDITHPEDRERHRANFQSVMDGDQDHWEIEKRYLRNDNSVIWVRVTGRVLRDAERGPYLATAVVSDLTRERQTEQALRESGERTRLAMQAGRMFAFEWNPHTDEVRRSYDCADITGSLVDATRELGKDSFKRVHPDDQERLSRTIKSLTPTNDTYEIQYRVIRPDGQIAAFQQSGRAFFDHSAVMVRLIGVTADITERKHTESALRESEQRLRAIFSQAAVGIAQASIDGEWLFLNDRYCEIVGHTHAELLGKTALDITHPEDRAASLAGIQRLLAGEASPRLVVRRYIRKDGTIVWVRLFVSLVRDQDNRPQYFIAVAEDVTERVQAERDRQESEQRLMLAQSAAHLGLWDWDLRTNVQMAFGEYLRHYGLPADHPPITYEEWLRLVHPEDRERVQSLLQESLERTHVWDVEFRVVWPDGRVRWLLGKGTVLLDGSGQPVRMMGVNLDITERKQAEQKFSALLESAPDAMVVVNQEGRIVLVNSQIEKVFRYRREELLGQKIDILIPERFKGRHLGFQRDYFAEPRARSMGSGWALYGRRQDGTEFPIEVSLGPVTVGEGLLVVAAIRDITERKRVDEALRESEERFRRVFEEGPLGLALVDMPRYRFVKINTAFCQMVGYSEAELLQLSFVDITHPDDLQADLELAKQLFKREVPYYQLQKRYVKKNGEIIWIHLTASLIHDEEGEALHGLAMIEDITERKRAEEVRSHLAAVVESSDDAIIGETLEGVVVSWNPGAERMYGYKAEEMIGQPISLLVPPERADDIPRILERLRHGQRLERCEIIGIRKDGRRIEVSIAVAPIIDSTGAVVGVSAISHDVTEQKRAHAALRESEGRFRNMADTAPVMIWVSGPDKLCTFVNQGYLTFTGSTMDKAIGNGWSMNVHPDDRDRCNTDYSLAFDARRSFQSEYRLRRADGEYRWVLATGNPRFEPGGALAGYVGSCMDITDIKRAHEEDLAKQKLETVGTLAGSIAHDFNNLLGAVLVHSELAMAVIASGSPPVEELEAIRVAATRGAEIVRQLMVYAGEEGELLEDVDVSEIARDMLELLKLSVSKHVSVEADLGKQLPAVRAHPAQIRQVVMNLVHNASEAIGDREGVIRVTTTQVTGPDSSTPTSEPMTAGDYLQLEVSDTGRGMTPEVQVRIFDRFFTTKATGGHGLGLMGVQRIVQLLHGTIRLSSVPGKGTTIRILLPSAGHMVAPTHNSIAGAEDEKLALQDATILVVEDEELLRQGISKMLQRNGFSVCEASDGTAALQLIRARKGEISVILLDITLPGASSREVYEEAKRLIPELPVIFTSAKSKEMADAALGTSVQCFIRKPFRLSDLIDIVREVISKRT